MLRKAGSGKLHRSNDQTCECPVRAGRDWRAYAATANAPYINAVNLGSKRSCGGAAPTTPAAVEEIVASGPLLPFAS